MTSEELNLRHERIVNLARRLSEALFPAVVVIPTGNKNADQIRYEEQHRRTDMRTGSNTALLNILPFMTDDQLSKIENP